MIKFLSYLSVFLGLVAYIFYTLYTNAKDKITALETEKNALKGNITYLEKTIEENNEAILQASKRAEQLEELAKKTKDNVWHHTFSNDDPVIARLRED
jgi:predicted nuclease with TOPRIM domain